MHLVINGRFLQQDVTGVQRVSIEFVRALDALLVEGQYPGLDVEIVLPAGGALAEEPNYKAIAVRRYGRLTGHAWEQTELPRYVRSSGSQALLCLGNVAPLSLLWGGFPVFTMVHDLSFRYFPSAYSRSFRIGYSALMPVVLSRSRVVFTVSESEKAAILGVYGKRIHPERLVVAQNGGARVNRASLPAQTPPLTERSRRCLYVGSLTARKNARGLLEAAVRLAREDGVDWTFVGGTGASFEATGLRVPDDVSSHITFLGQVNDPNELDTLYRQATAFVFPSFYEASPLPPIESMSHGCPVVAADIPSLRERCGDAALYCDPHDVESIVTQVRQLLNGPETWRDFQERGLRQATRYSWRTQAETILGVVLSTTESD